MLVPALVQKLTDKALGDETDAASVQETDEMLAAKWAWKCLSLVHTWGRASVQKWVPASARALAATWGRASVQESEAAWVAVSARALAASVSDSACM